MGIVAENNLHHFNHDIKNSKKVEEIIHLAFTKRESQVTKFFN